MQIKPRRPWMTGCILYLVMLAALFLLSDFWILQGLLAALVVIGLVVCACLNGGEHIRLPGLLSVRKFCIGALIPVLLAVFGVVHTLWDYRALHVETETSVLVAGVVERVYYATDSGASFLLDLHTVDGKRSGGKIRIDSSGHALYANIGEKIACTVRLGQEEQLADYDENIQYAFPDGIFAYAEAVDTITMQGSRMTFRSLCADIAAWCRQQLYRYLPEDAAELCISILLGEKSVLPAALKRDFRRVGVSHMLAVSGMHFSILINGLLMAMRRIGIRFRLRYSAALVFIVFYMGVTGCAPSVMRAGLVWMLSCIAELIYAKTDALTSLFTAAAVLCILSPYAVFDIGFLLSVSASLGLILLMPPLNQRLNATSLMRWRMLRPIRTVILVMATTFSATIFTTPITLLVFGEISTMAPLANLLLHIPIVVLMYGVPALLVLSLIAFVPPVGILLHFLSGVLSGASALTADITGWLSRLPYALVGVRYPFVPVLLCVFFLLFLFLYRKRRTILWVYPIYAVFLIALFIAVQIHAFTVRGDVTLTYSPNEKNDNVSVVTDGRGMLIDASDGSWSNMKRAWEQLSAQNLTSLDACVLTHYHNRHTSQLAKLAQNVVLDTVVLPYPETDEEDLICAALQDIAASYGMTVRMYTRGEDDIVFGDAVLRLFPMERLSRSVQPVLGWRMTAHGQTAVYLGGAAFETSDGGAYATERDAALTESDYLLLGIHGPLYKSGIPAIEKIIPEHCAVIAANSEIRSFLGDVSEITTVYSAEQHGSVRAVLESD